MAQVRTRAWREGKIVASEFPVAEVSEHLAVPGTTVWVDLCQPDAAEFGALGDELGLHELAVEDALGAHQRPKVDYYDTHLFLSCHAVTLDAGAGELRTTEVDAFVGDRWFITVRKNGGFDIAPVCHHWDRSPHLVEQGVGALLYGLLDEVVDGYFDTVQAFDDYYDAVSEGLFADEPLDPNRQRDWFRMRRALVQFHRLVVPMREAISSLMRREHDTVGDAMHPYFQDVYDHILRVTESTDALRDLVSTIVETNLSLRDFRQNQIMKKVTSWAAIIAVPTLITGYYGMNVPYPGFARYWGVWISTGLMGGISGFLYWSFKRRDWL